MKYSDLLAKWLRNMGYTHCFFVPGGNVMHLVASCSAHFRMVGVVHEVAAGIAAEYFNEAHPQEKAFALVTAGPGLTNVVTALAGAFLESRELLVLGGQVKTADLRDLWLRQRGIQEIDGVRIAEPVCCVARRLDAPVSLASFQRWVGNVGSPRPGPVFLELPLDVQARSVDEASLERADPAEGLHPVIPLAGASVKTALVERIRAAERPVLLLGGGVSRKTMRTVYAQLEAMGIPLMTTWNGADRVGAEHPLYFGRPNTWGQRYANVLLQKCDLLVALGTRLGLQQTGFRWQEFVPEGEVLQVEIDPAELSKGHPHVEWPVLGDANDVLRHLAGSHLGDHTAWVRCCSKVRDALPLVEPNHTGAGYVSPYRFYEEIAGWCRAEDVVIPCSSGCAYTVAMQVFAQRWGQTIITNKGLASMGYGLSGAIGAALAHPDRRTILFEGDGGFAQNLQELGTVVANRLSLKIFLFDDQGYASIRMTQQSYFAGRFVGCEVQGGLGLPPWDKLFAAYGIPVLRIDGPVADCPGFAEAFEAPGPCAFVLAIDPAQTYFPKITSRVAADGTMQSNPLHRMTPEVPDIDWAAYCK
ncbi:thiamine pyrophosphate-binding protein [Candidatus Symbiobacter mobilis]|uniref:Acetolactate synthase large subunit n=1 Tax=Candidatus Symbiobacter mobilis CR TaxID=946483 RepID=U5N848_9BURK|nr:thiamine pyrophosphate-binding protein [Candidatus Symbiobacter mobilis]AGX87485.1 acetolactate synthase large subunit [Candidatus Symbiobacter mobilis CR]